MNSERMKKFISLLLAGSMALGLLLPGVSAFAEDGDEQPSSEPSVAQTLVEKITEAAAAAAQNESPPTPETPSQPDTPPQGDPEPLSESPGEPPAPHEGTDPEPDAPGVTEDPAQPEPPREEEPATPAPPEEEKPPEEPTPAEQKEKEQELEEARAHRSDPAADVEIPSEWAAMFEKLDLTGKYPDDLLAVARTQIGYTESEANYAEADGQRRGYTRYGAWNQDPYAPWNLTFVAFCLEYAQVPEDAFPREDDPETWRQTLTEQNLWTTEAPKPGDVAFLPKDPETAIEEETEAALVGIVDEIEEDGTLWVIAGDMENEVRRIELASDQIIGFGVLPPGEERQDPQPTDPAGTDVPADNGEPPADYDTPQAPLDPAEPGTPVGDLAGDLAQRIAEAIQPEPPPAEEPQPEELPVEELPEEVPTETFVRAQTVDEVTVTVTATPGTFPEDAALSVTRVPVAAQIAVDAAVAPQRDGSTVAASYTFDVTMLDGQGSPLQPADGGTVRVSFSMAEVADANLAPRVYHIEGEGEDLSAQPLDVETEGDTATVVTEGFSYYTVEFTYNNMQYVLEGGATVPLADILAFVGLSGEVTDVEVSAPVLFSAELADGQWVIVSHGPFTSEEWMKVTIDGVVYEIVVTDANPSSGTIDGAVYWWISNGKLTIRLLNNKSGVVGFGYKTSGSDSEKSSRTSKSDWPWNSFRNEITKVEFRSNNNGVKVQFVETYDGGGRAENFMFADCKNLTSVNLSGLDTTNAGGLARMFSGCTNLRTVDMSGLKNDGKLHNLQNMFNGCTSLESVILPANKTDENDIGFQLKDNAQLAGMFDGCTRLTTINNLNGLGNIQKAKTMKNMFRNCSALTELDVSSFGKLENIINMDGFVQGCTSLVTLNINNLDNSNIGPTNNWHGIWEGEDIVQTTGAAEYGRQLNIETCIALKTLSAQNSKVWMCKNNRGTPGAEYYNASSEDDVLYFTQNQMTFQPDGHAEVNNIITKRDYIDLLTDRDGLNMPGEVGAWPDQNTNINIKNGDLNPHGAGRLPPGVYKISNQEWEEPQVKAWSSNYYIEYSGEPPSVDVTNLPNDSKIVVTPQGENWYINTEQLSDWDNYTDRDRSFPCNIQIKYPNSVVEGNNREKRHDLIITINSVTFKNIGKVPRSRSDFSSDRYHDENYYAGGTYYRTILRTTTSDGLVFLNYARQGYPGYPQEYTQVLTGGSGTYIDFTLSVSDAKEGEELLFLGHDLDVGASQSWVRHDDACLDNLPIENLSYGAGSEGFILGEGNKLASLCFADHTGLELITDPETKNPYVVGTGPDPDTAWSEFTIKGSAKSANYIWTSGIACTSYLLKPTGDGIDWIVPQDLLPSTGGFGLPILIKLALGSMVLTTPVTWIKRKWGVGG